MKFQVRDGFVATIYTKIEKSAGVFETRQSDFFAGEAVDFTPEQAEANLHKLEPKDKAAADWLLANVTPAEQPQPPAAVSEIVAKAVAEAIASFTAGLKAAGVASPQLDLAGAKPAK